MMSLQMYMDNFNAVKNGKSIVHIAKESSEDRPPEWSIILDNSSVGKLYTMGIDYAISHKVDLSRYPHTCPKCSSPAYVGFSTVECSSFECNECDQRERV